MFENLSKTTLAFHCLWWLSVVSNSDQIVGIHCKLKYIYFSSCQLSVSPGELSTTLWWPHVVWLSGWGQHWKELPSADDHTIQTTDTPGFKPFTIMVACYLFNSVLFPNKSQWQKLINISIGKTRLTTKWTTIRTMIASLSHIT